MNTTRKKKPRQCVEAGLSLPGNPRDAWEAWTLYSTGGARSPLILIKRSTAGPSESVAVSMWLAIRRTSLMVRLFRRSRLPAGRPGPERLPEPAQPPFRSTPAPPMPGTSPGAGGAFFVDFDRFFLGVCRTIILRSEGQETRMWRAFRRGRSILLSQDLQFSFSSIEKYISSDQRTMPGRML